MSTLLKIPLVRHLFAGIAICLGLYAFAIFPLQRELTKMHQQVDKDRELIESLSQKDTYSISNQVDGRRMKKGSTITMTPDNDLSVVNADSTGVKKKGFLKRIFKKD